MTNLERAEQRLEKIQAERKDLEFKLEGFECGSARRRSRVILERKYRNSTWHGLPFHQGWKYDAIAAVIFGLLVWLILR